MQKESLVKALESPMESIGNNRMQNINASCRLMGPLGIRAVFRKESVEMMQNTKHVTQIMAGHIGRRGEWE